MTQGTNGFLPFASSSDANVMSDADYAASLGTGGSFAVGVSRGQASSAQANKTWRQSTVMAAAVAQVICDLGPSLSDSLTQDQLKQLIGYAYRWYGLVAPFSKQFASSVGGYTKGSIVVGSTPGSYWISLVDNNTTDPSEQGSTPVWQDLFHSVSAAIATVQSNLNSAVANQASINSSVETSLDDKLSISKGGTIHGDLHIGDSKWLYTDTIRTETAPALSVLNGIHASGDIHVGNRNYLYTDYINSQSETNIGILTHATFRASMSVSNAGKEFGGNQTDADNPIGGKLDGSYFDGRTLYQYSNGTTPTYIGTGTTGSIINLFYGSTQVGAISTNGTSVSYNTTSDYRLKHNVEPVDQNACINIIKRLRPVSFTWKATGTEDVGFLAHEVQDVVPNAVLGEKDGEKSQLLDTKPLIPYLLSVVQNLMTRVEELEASK